MVPLSRPHITEAEIASVTEVLKSGWLTHGPKTTEFENRVAEYIGVKHAVAMNSATSALYTALLAQDIRGEVILPSFTFVASANAVVNAGATPVFADIERATRNIDPDDIIRKITPATEAIMVVHYAGHAARMDRIMQIAEEHHLAVIEDSAETFGGAWRGQKCGSFGTGVFSFFPTKNITCGEGGMLTTNDDALAARVRALIGHGITTSTADPERSEKPWHRSASFAGHNFRLSNLLAAIGVEQMRKVDLLNRARQRHARFFNEHLAEFDEIHLPVEMPGASHVYQMYTVCVEGVERDAVLKSLRSRGIGASVHFDPPVHLHEYYRADFGDVKLPVTDWVGSNIITLPMFPGLTRDEREEVVDAIGEILEETRSADRICA